MSPANRSLRNVPWCDRTCRSTRSAADPQPSDELQAAGETATRWWSQGPSIQRRSRQPAPVSLATICWISGLLAMLACEDTQAATVAWKTEAAFQRALAESVSVTWSQTPLRAALHRLATRQRVAVFLDRRIDPNQRIAFQSPETQLRDLLQQLASNLHAETAHLGSVVYLGPPDDTLQLPSVAEACRQQVAQLPRRQAARFQNKRRWYWPSATTPRDLIQELAHEAQVVVQGLDQVPHDLWPETDLPPLTWTDRLTLVLAGFGLTFSVHGEDNSVNLRPIVAESSLVRHYSHTLSQIRLNEIVSEFSNSTVRASADSIELKGNAQDHERLQRLLRQSASPRATRHKSPARTVYTLRVEQQKIGSILQVIAQRSDLELDFAAVPRSQLETRVSFDVQEVTLSELLSAILAPAGLVYRQTEDTLSIHSSPDGRR